MLLAACKISLKTVFKHTAQRCKLTREINKICCLLFWVLWINKNENNTVNKANGIEWAAKYKQTHARTRETNAGLSNIGACSTQETVHNGSNTEWLGSAKMVTTQKCTRSKNTMRQTVNSDTNKTCTNDTWNKVIISQYFRHCIQYLPSHVSFLLRFIFFSFGFARVFLL